MAIAKWGFGMAPISKVMGIRYENAVKHTLQLLDGVISLEDANIEYISELKGMFNRGLKQDQWDWFTVHCKLGSPSNGNAFNIVKILIDFRQTIKDKNWSLAEELKKTLINYRLSEYLLDYLNNNSIVDSGTGYIYILSTREAPKILKIGMTTRSIDQRVKEVNSATGVLYPYSARKIFKVKNAKQAESKIFESLKSYRLRPDREFFNIEFDKAVSIIVQTLLNENLLNRKKGVIKWFNVDKGFGFIITNDNKEIYFNSDEIINNTNLIDGVSIEFDIKDTPKGAKVVNIYIQ